MKKKTISAVVRSSEIFKVSPKFKRKLKVFIIIAILILIPIIGMALVNIPYISYFTPEEVDEYKDSMYFFSNSHQNSASGLFIEADIDSNFRIATAINWTSFNPQIFNLINPVDNDYLKSISKPNFYLDYLFDKQNKDGSFSDIGGLGDMFTTYQVIDTIMTLNESYINSIRHQDKINRIMTFLNSSSYTDPANLTTGFKNSQFSLLPDMISTSNAVEIANYFSWDYFLNNQNITNYILGSLRTITIGSLITGWGYSNSLLSADPDAESTFYGIKAYLGLNKSYSTADKILFMGFFNDIYDPLNGGFRNTLISINDIESTYYCLSSIERLNYSYPVLFNASRTLNFILNCSDPDGGFGLRPDILTNYSSDFVSSGAAMKALAILERNFNFSEEQQLAINETKSRFYTWLSGYQALNGLFGHITIESNYWGVLSAIQYYPSSFLDHINVKNIFAYINSCYVIETGGYSSEPFIPSSLFSTYLAINMYDIFTSYVDDLWLYNESATEAYIASLQNPDGGFRIGNDQDSLFRQLGVFYSVINDLIDVNTSIVESTYWAVESLDILGALNLIDLNNLTHFIRSCQNADGGFGLFLGFSYSDIISTYYALHVFYLFDSEPLSKILAINFLKNAQNTDGSFSPMPTLSMLGLSVSFFLVTYLGAKGLYDFSYQPTDIWAFLDWFVLCVDKKTGGVGDVQGFGGDLRNTVYGMIIIDDLRYDRAFDPEPWTTLFTRILLVEIIAIVGFILLKMSSYANVVILRRIKAKLGIGEKMEVSYLRRYPAIRCENLSIFAGRKLIVNSMSLTLEHGEILGVLGESGAGKSTFVKSLLGMRKFKGTNQVYGMDVKKKSKKMRPIYGYVPQDLSKIYEDFTTYQNILYFGRQYGLSEREIRRKAKRILRSLEIDDKMHEQVKNLSGGQKRRVSIAIGLIHDPIIVWMDEPTSGLDPVVRENLWHALTRINEEFNTTLIVITHYPEESRFCNKVAIFGRGRGLIDFGHPKDLLGQLPGKGRTIGLIFRNTEEKALERLESILGISKALENKAGMEFSLLSDLNIRELKSRIELEFGLSSIAELKQTDSKMEEYFRYRAMDVPSDEIDLG
ncbi:MAG: ATP-binding cassette domain-containing protein [Candidatus Lokiarchaeota archaeon]|nr:ATP-binding cassette domain-containing protein [Candidatus Lokiarchaeota archaeon]